MPGMDPASRPRTRLRPRPVQRVLRAQTTVLVRSCVGTSAVLRILAAQWLACPTTDDSPGGVEHEQYWGGGASVLLLPPLVSRD